MEFSEVIKKRRSTRKFTNDGVSREQIIKMLEAATIAPNACNMQSWHFYVVTDKAVKAKLADESAIAEWATTAPVMFVVCSDAKEIVARFGARAENLFTVQDTAAAIENLLLCAADMGLGGCFMGAFNEEKVRATVGVKEDHRPVAVVPVGVPAVELPARPRNPLESVVTFVGEGDGEHTELDTAYRKFEVKNSCVPEAVFDNVNLKNSTFNNINLSGTKFSDINLSGTKFSDINMKNCKYGGLTMEGSSFGCVDMKKCEFNNTELCCSNFENVTFGGSDMKNVDMSCVEFEKINFKNATFDDVDFSDASFDDVDFSGATADGIDIAEAIEFYKTNQDK